ncbi:alpha-1A adrenergic receptor isoform X6 [Camelus ferus]|uniref:Alpha-1A adrenergic receptor n=2 Tax=Camelus TaxID=9836 RepID=A0A8B8S9N3_CAMFR|nr:alpha-1A adrenergic receptor isoform X5 [Camelus dromedarius]XP_032326943.1 alpha-1A adrenergic receptor isoform X6 [Camelus ferus]XP_045367600.1 alpha-1A adrenergic receptor isoform X5 [Camelus bactrianus]
MVFLSGNVSDSSNCTHPPPPVNISKAILLGVILGSLIIFGVLGNILVILSVACHRHLHSVTHYYIVNLAVADLLLTSTVLPFSAIFEILGYWAFGRVFCNIWAAVDVLCCTASILGLCIISIDRYIGVSYPLRYPTIVTQKRGLMALLCVWALSLVISVGPLFGWRQPAPEDETICQITEEPGYVLFSALGSFYVPLAIILVMYCRVYVVAKRESRGLKSGLKTDKSDSEQVTLRIHRKNAPAGGSGVSSAKNKTHFSVRLLKFSREKKAAKTLGIVVGCFVLCWLPFFLVMPIGIPFRHLYYRLSPPDFAKLPEPWSSLPLEQLEIHKWFYSLALRRLFSGHAAFWKPYICSLGVNCDTLTTITLNHILVNKNALSLT